MDNLLLEKVPEMPANERVVFAELILASIYCEEKKRFASHGLRKSATA